MERSPAQREIERVVGNPGAIISRGEAITSLGQKMEDCADTLKSIKDGAVGGGSQKGKAIDQLKEEIGDSADKLKEASELYKPVGPVIETYGEALSECKPVINDAVEDCETYWAAYAALPGDKDGPKTAEDVVDPFAALRPPDHEGPTFQQTQQAQANQEKSDAYDKWFEAAGEFDKGYNSWKTAFDDAARDIGNEMSGKIKDGRWDNFKGFVDVVTTVLSWAALVVGVIALFAGGWVLALVALALSAVVLTLTALQAMYGDKSWLDVGFAALAILPVGKLSHLTKFAQFPKLSKFVGLRSGGSRVWGALSKGPIDKFVKARGGKAFEALSRTKIRENVFGPTMQTVKKTHYKMYFNNNQAVNLGYQAAKANLSTMRVAMKIDLVLGTIATYTGHWGKLATAVSNSTGGNKSISLPKGVGVVI